MSGIVVVSASPELAGRVEQLASVPVHGALAAQMPTYPVQVFGLLPEGTPTPHVVLLDCSDHREPGSTHARPADSAFELTTRLRQLHPATSVVLVTREVSELALAALRAGVQDLVSPDAATTDLAAVLDRALAAAEARLAEAAQPEEVEQPSVAEDKPGGRVISVVSPKGGVGKTTVSVNLAVGLARVAPKSTVLVDLDVQFGDVASGLNLDPEYFLESAVHGPASQDTMVLKTYLTLHETGLYVICAPESPVVADTITAAEVSKLLRTLAAEFRYVVVDTAPGMGDHTLAAMDASSDLVLLTSMDVPGLRGLRKEVDTLNALEMVPSGRHVVINFADPRSGLTVGDVEATIGAPVNVMLPRSKATPNSVNIGVPLLQSGVRDPMATQLRRLVSRFVETGETAKMKAAAPGFEKNAKNRPTPKRAATGWFRRPRTIVTAN